MEMMLEKSKFKRSSYLNSKWAIKQLRQLTISTKHLPLELLTDIQCSGGSRKFSKETRALKMRSTVAGHWKLATINWEHHQSWSSYNYMISCQNNSASTILWSFGIWSKLERQKSSNVGASWTDWQSKKSSFRSVIFSYSTQQQWTISWLDHNMWWKVDFIQPAMTSSVTGTKNCKRHSWHWSTERAQFFSMTIPEHMLHNNTSKVGQIGLQSFASSTIFTWVSEWVKVIQSCSTLYNSMDFSMEFSSPWNSPGQNTGKGSLLQGIFQTQDQTQVSCTAGRFFTNWATHDLLPNDYHFFKHLGQPYAGKTLPQPARGKKWFPRVRQVLKHGFLCYKNKPRYFSLAKMCWLQWFLFWLIKMCLSPVIMI